jgi:hypothetical protein
MEGSGDPEASDLTNSDASSTSMKSSDGYLPSTDPTTSGSSSESDEDASEDMEEMIEFIGLKRRILKGASMFLFDHEDAYNASTARTTSHTMKPNELQGSLWTQAKGIVSQKALLQPRKGVKRGGLGFARASKKIVKPNPRDPKIDLNEVGHVDATQFDVENPRKESEDYRMSKLSDVTFFRGQWMTQGLVRSSNSFFCDMHSNQEQNRWKVIADPLTCSLGLVPPASVDMKHGISIEDALLISDEPRILTQATPPFCVLYANKAFMIFAGIKVRDPLIGKPIESILLVRPEAINVPRSDQRNDFLPAHFHQSAVASSFIPDEESASDDLVPCRMMIVPVMNQPQRLEKDATETSSKSFSCMTHVLIRIHRSDDTVSPLSYPTTLHLDEFLSISKSAKRKDESSTTSSSQTSQDSILSNALLETIG